MYEIKNLKKQVINLLKRKNNRSSTLTILPRKTVQIQDDEMTKDIEKKGTKGIIKITKIE